MSVNLWEKCSGYLQEDLPSTEYNMWIRPLQADLTADGGRLVLWAPNHFVVDWINNKYLALIEKALNALAPSVKPTLEIKVGTRPEPVTNHQNTIEQPAKVEQKPAFSTQQKSPIVSKAAPMTRRSNLARNFTFANFVEGKSNRMASAAAQQVAESPSGQGYNPLLLYGGVGLGKTHLMHAVGNAILARKPDAKVVYLSSERFVGDMVAALRNKTIDSFQRFYRSLDALLIDDIQFFAGKGQSQEEFFHTFNTLMEKGQQIVLTCDKFPKEIDGLEDRLKSRFGWGLSQPLEPPELETRVAILKKKAEEDGVLLPDTAAFFIAQNIQSNVRELEGVLKRVIAHSRFSGTPINIDQVKSALRDVLAMQARLVNVDNIQRVVANYYKIKLNDLLSASRRRSVARPRQVAMALSKELTRQSYPEIGEAFGGRDHTTVLHACRRVTELRSKDADIDQDYTNLLRSLTS